MASIDWIHGNWTQWNELHKWVARSKRPQYCQYFAPTPPYEENNSYEGRIFSGPLKADQWLWDNCPFEWVKEELKLMYNGSPYK